MTYVQTNLKEARKRLRNRLVEVGHASMVVPDSYHAEQLRETAYRWGRDNNYVVTVAVSNIDQSILHRRVTASVGEERKKVTNMPENNQEKCYIVDWEADEENPIVVEVQVTKVIRGDVDPEYLGQLIADSAGTLFNLVVAESEEAALGKLEGDSE